MTISKTYCDICGNEITEHSEQCFYLREHLKETNPLHNDVCGNCIEKIKNSINSIVEDLDVKPWKHKIFSNGGTNKHHDDRR